MLHLRFPTRYLTGLVTVLGVLAAACTDSTGPNSQPLTRAEAQVIASEVADEAAGVASTLTFGDLSSPSLFPSPATGPDVAPTHFPGRPNCPTVTPNPLADSDGDGVPDDATLTYTLPECRFTGPDGGTVELTGTVRITDPSTTAAGHRAAFTDFQRKFIRPDGNYFLSKLNGVRQVLRSPTGFSAIDQTTAEHESSEHPAGSKTVRDWTVEFVPDPGSTIQLREHLPSGNLTISGSVTRTSGEVTHSFTVATLTPLHFDATCTGHPKFTSGELRLTRTGPRGTVTIRIVFNGCGQEPTVTVEGGA